MKSDTKDEVWKAEDKGREEHKNGDLFSRQGMNMKLSKFEFKLD